MLLADVQTWISGGQLALILAAALLGWRQLAHARGLREEESRPFVIVELGSSRPKFYDLVVRNAGAAVARDVTFEFDPPMETTGDHIDLDDLKIFREGMSTLPPGREFRTLLDAGPARHDSGLPDVYTVTVTYEGPVHERWWGKRWLFKRREPYTEELDLDFGLYWNRTFIQVRTLHDVHQELERIRELFSNWDAGMGNGLLHISPSELRRKQRRELLDLEKHKMGPPFDAEPRRLIRARATVGRAKSRIALALRLR